VSARTRRLPARAHVHDPGRPGRGALGRRGARRRALCVTRWDTAYAQPAGACVAAHGRGTCAAHVHACGMCTLPRAPAAGASSCSRRPADSAAGQPSTPHHQYIPDRPHPAASSPQARPPSSRRGRISMPAAQPHGLVNQAPHRAHVVHEPAAKRPPRRLRRAPPAAPRLVGLRQAQLAGRQVLQRHVRQLARGCAGAQEEG